MGKALKPLIIPVFIPHSGCPHQCAFCNQRIITNQQGKLPDKKAIHHIISEYYQYKGKREKVELAFFGGNFLGLANDDIIRMLEYIQPFIKNKKIDGIRFSTRPDTINDESIDLIKPYTISAIELGVQSMNDDVLLKSKRGHTCQDTINAIHMLKECSFRIGVQVMVGLPGDNDSSLVEGTKHLVQLMPDFARIYPLMVLKGSLLEQWYAQGKYHPISLEKSIQLVKEMVKIFEAANVDVIRMGLQSSDLMEDQSLVIAGPWHPAFGHLVYSEIMYDTACDQIDKCKGWESKKLFVKVHPKSESRLRGNKNGNLKKLYQRYPGLDLTIQLDERVPINQINIGLINN